MIGEKQKGTRQLLLASPSNQKKGKTMLSISVNGKNRNDHSDPDKRAEKNRIRQIRRHLRKTNCDMRKVGDSYYPVCIDPAFEIRDMEIFGREIHAIPPVGICGGCRGIAWHHVEGVDLCDSCATEVRR